MLFSSMTFLWVFLPCVFLICILLKSKYQNAFLMVVSLLFYAWGEPSYLVLMLLSIFVNWLFGLGIEKFSESKRLFLIVSVVFNLAILGYYKYYDFLAETINHLVGKSILPIKEIALPIGISFFTFQIMSYVIDLYRGQYKAQKNIVHLALYISFFPQLIAGPIVKYRDINEQIEHRTLNVEKTVYGLRRFTYGLGKKVLISNVLAECVDSIYTLPITEIGMLTAWIAAILYTFQIYYDFSGYSDMAIGLGKMFGFDFLENFNYPYLSGSIHEFWQRWHISLGTWFREYVYFPLGGNKKGKFRTYVNLTIVFLLTGAWHGASWNFVFWGAYHGFFQIIERLGLERVLKKTKILKHLYAFLVVVVGWVFFRVENLTMALNFVGCMFMPWKYGVSLNYSVSHKVYLIAVLAVLGCGILQAIFHRYKRIENFWKNSPFELVFCCCVLLLSFMSLASNTYNPFIYFRF